MAPYNTVKIQFNLDLRRTAAYLVLTSLCLFSHTAIGNAQPPAGDAAPRPPAATKQAPEKVNLGQILSNPIPGKEEFKYLYQRRRWLAAHADDPANFEKLAEEFAAKGAYFSGIELLWFADKMTEDETQRGGYRAKMKGWIEAADEVNQKIERGEQLALAGRSKEAFDLFREALSDNVYAEKAHYNIANTCFRTYLKQAVEEDDLLPLATRAKLFRVIYEESLFTIAIDPIFYDAYHLIGGARELLPDQPEFLGQSEIFSTRALKFHDDLLPILEEMEKGNRDPELIARFGHALEDAGVMDYAVFAYQTASRRKSSDTSLEGKIKALTEKYFSEKTN